MRLALCNTNLLSKWNRTKSYDGCEGSTGCVIGNSSTTAAFADAAENRLRAARLRSSEGHVPTGRCARRVRHRIVHPHRLTGFICTRRRNRSGNHLTCRWRPRSGWCAQNERERQTVRSPTERLLTPLLHPKVSCDIGWSSIDALTDESIAPAASTNPTKESSDLRRNAAVI